MQFSSSLLLKCPCLPGVKGIMCPAILLCYASCICSEYGIDIKSWKSTKISLSISSYSSMLVACRFRTYVPMKGHREFHIFYTTPVGFTRTIRISQYSVILSLWESVYVLKSVLISLVVSHMLSGNTDISTRFGRNRAVFFNYNTLYPFKNYLNMHCQDAILQKFRLL